MILADDIVSDLRNGWTVDIEAPTRTQVSEIFEALACKFDDVAGSTISRVLGRESISTSSGGRLRLSIHPNSPVRITLR